MKRSLAGFGVAGLAMVLGAIALVAVTAASATEPEPEGKKVWVCKYVGTPGVDEVLQTGDAGSPGAIDVSVNALGNYSGLGSYFNDKQGRSYAVGPEHDHPLADDAPAGPCPSPAVTKGKLVITKVVINDGGGTKTASDFSFTVNRRGPFGFESDGSNSYAVDPGSYAVAEVAAEGYTSSGGDTVSIAAGETKTVTITNDDVKEGEDGKGTLIVKKVVVNDNGGTAEADDFSFRINGRGPVAFESDGTNSFQVPAGYVATVVEVAAEGYTTTYSERNGGTVEEDDILTITVTNDDVKGEEPPPPPHEVTGGAAVSCILPDGYYSVSGTVDRQTADNVSPATIPGNAKGAREVVVTRGDASVKTTVSTNGDCGNASTPPVVTPPAVVTTPPVQTVPTTPTTAPFTPPATTPAVRKPAVKKPAAKTPAAKAAPAPPKKAVAGAFAKELPKLAYTP